MQHICQLFHCSAKLCHQLPARHVVARCHESPALHLLSTYAREQKSACVCRRSAGVRVVDGGDSADQRRAAAARAEAAVCHGCLHEHRRLRLHLRLWPLRRLLHPVRRQYISVTSVHRTKPQSSRCIGKIMSHLVVWTAFSVITVRRQKISVSFVPEAILISAVAL